MATSEDEGLLARAATYVVKAGGAVKLPRRLAAVRSVSIAGTAIPYDVVPVASDKRAIDLATEGHLATSATVVTSYEGRPPDERNTPGNPEFPIPIPAAPREHAVVIGFGTGQATHAIEIDVTEGNAVSIPTQSLEAQIVHYTTVLDDIPVSAVLATQASAAYQSASAGCAVKTMRALIPLGLFDLPAPGAGNLPPLSGANNRLQAHDVLHAVLARPLPATTARGAYRNAIARVRALVPPTTPIP